LRRQLKKGLLITGISIIVLILLSPCFYGLLLVSLEMPHWFSWRERTSPLSENVLGDLCEQFHLGDKDSRCKPGAKVYAPDFFKTIREDFINSHGEVANYDYVQEKIGKYQYRCGPVHKDSSAEYFICDYDLQGDRVYPIVIFFYSSGQIWRISASVTD
jgi:hypothetical protein